MGGALTLYYLTFVAFICGVVLSMSGNVNGRKLGYGFIITAIIMFLASYLIVQVFHWGIEY
ncbi:MAG: hypothetical protein EBX41_01595 [Chitinophagia bacterium]|nr:hypothetical protein [Chitinophagia bacterium]